MKKNLAVLAIIFSVVLNVVFIGSYLYHESGLFPRRAGKTEHKRLLYEALNLNREQLERFGPVRDSFHAFVKEQGRKIKAGRLALIDLLAREHPDLSAIDAKREEIQALQGEMKTRVIDHLLEEGRILTPEQRRRFFALIKERLERSDGPRPRWMPRAQEKASKGKRP